MAKTIIGLNDAKAVKRYSGLLAVDVAKQGYWSRKFMGSGPAANAPVHQLLELANKSKGGFWMGMTIASGVGGVISWIASHWKA